MRTFFTSSSLAVLSAVVFAGYLVKTGDELPRRSLESYPSMTAAIQEPMVEVPSIEEPPSVIADIVTPEVTALSEVRDDGSEAVEAKPEKEQVREKRVSFEPHGPPAPVLPFVLNINAAEEGVSLQGSIPTQGIKAEISEAIASALDEEKIENRLKFSPDTRSGLWITYLPGFIESYFRHTGGNHEMTIVDGKLMLSGAVASEEAKKAVLKWTKPLLKRGLKLEEQVDVDETLKGKLPEIPAKVVEEKPTMEADEPVDLAEAEAEPPEPDERGDRLTSEETGGATVGEELVFLAPFDEQYEVHTVPDLRSDIEETSKESSSGTDSEKSLESNTEAEIGLSAPLFDDGKPLIFRFDSGSGEIAQVDLPKIDFAIERAQKGRCIVYITGYSDYRGSFEQNQKLAMSRVDRVKGLIFDDDFDHDVSAEVKTKGDILSQKRPGKETEEQLRRARRVVVEVYHLR